VFHEHGASRLFNRFQDNEDEARLLTVSAEHPASLGWPWELLHDSEKGGAFLFNEMPRISIRRRHNRGYGRPLPLQDSSQGVVSTYSSSSAVRTAPAFSIRAAGRYPSSTPSTRSPRRVTCEFLRPATFDALLERLEDPAKPAVDILHFDGHGVFDGEGGYPTVSSRTEISSGATVLIRLAHPTPAICSSKNPNGRADFISAEKLGANLHRPPRSRLSFLAPANPPLSAGTRGKRDLRPRLRLTAWPHV